MEGKTKLKTEIKDLKERIELYKKSGIASLLSDQEKFRQQDLDIQRFMQGLSTCEKRLNSAVKTIKLPKLMLILTKLMLWKCRN